MNFRISEFFKYTILNIIGMVGVSLYVFADTYFIAQAFGSNGIVALNLTIPIYCLMSAIGLMVGIGGSTRFNILKSLNKDKDSYSMFSSSIKLGFLISLVFFLLGLFFSREISYFLGANEESITMTNIYLRTIMVFAPGFILNHIFTTFSRNDNLPRLSMTAMLSGSFINIILDYIFIFPLKMGMFGAALATGMSSLISVMIISFYYIVKKRDFLFFDEHIKAHQVEAAVKLGFPTFIIEVSAAILTGTFNLVTLDIMGNDGVAAYGIVGNISFVSFAVLNGLSQGTQPLFGRAYGLKDKESLKKVLELGIISGLVIAGLIYVGVYLNRHALALAFAEDGNTSVINMSVEGLKLYFIGYFFASVNMVSVMFLTSIEKIRNAFLISILRGLILSLPLLVILSETFNMTGVWASYIVTEAITMVISLFLIKSNFN